MTKQLRIIYQNKADSYNRLKTCYLSQSFNGKCYEPVNLEEVTIYDIRTLEEIKPTIGLYNEWKNSKEK